MPTPNPSPPPSAESSRPTGSRARITALEAAGLLLCLLLAGLLLANRVRSAPMPGGDEGSWLAVAAELAAGNGFSTRWLEYHYLEPYAVPRPDDMRYPALTALLALGMKVLGPSLLAMRGLVAATYLAFLAAAWLAVRLRFGSAAALLTAWLMALSPLQHEWASLVYCEGLFGLVLSGWLAWIQVVPRARRLHWAGSGALLALLCMVRPNGVLLVPGAALAAWLAFRKAEGPSAEVRPPEPRKAALLVAAAFLVGLSPWLVRNQVHFGEAFHVGGSAGLLRDSHQESATQGVGEFLGRYGILFPLRRIAEGVPRFFSSLHHFEKGLEVLPLLMGLAALALRRPFLPPAAALGFALSFLACLYASYNSWAGLRYFTPFLPFVYAYGLSLLPPVLARLAPKARYAAAAGLALLLALPTANPHRFWLRHYPAQETAYAAGLDGWIAALDARVPPERAYLAGGLCQVNYLAKARCVGLQGPGRDIWLPRAMAAFRPAALALTPDEASSADGEALRRELLALGWRAEEERRDRIGVLYRLRPASPPGP